MSSPEKTISRRALSPEEDRVEHHYREKLVAQGLERKDSRGHPQKHGLWKFWSYASETTEHLKEERYENGTLLEDEPNVAPVLVVLQAEGAAYQQYKSIEAAVGSYTSVIYSLRLLHRQGRAAPSLEFVRYLAEVCPPTDLSNLAYLFGQLGAQYAPLLTAMAEELLAKKDLNQDQHRHAAVAMLGLWRIDPASLTARFDPLLAAALEGVSFPHFSNQNVVYRFGQLLAGLSTQRREALLLRQSSYPYYLTSFAWTCPTPPVIAALLETLMGWYRGKHDSHWMYQAGALQGLRRVGHPLVAPLLELLQGAGKKAAQRDLFLIFLAERQAPEAAPVLVEFLADSIAAAKEAARRGLLALGEAALPALQAASTAKKSATQKAALAFLTERSQRLAQPKLAPPAGLLALRDLQGSISTTQRERWLSLFEAQERDGQLERSWIVGVSYLIDRLIRREAPRDLQALLFYSQYFLSLCRSGRVFELRLNLLLERCQEFSTQSPAILYLVAEILVTAPKDHFFNKVPREYQGKAQDPLFQRREAIKGLCRMFGKPLAEPLGYLLSIYEAEEEETLREWLAELS